MRKFILSLVVAIAAIAMTASLASGANRGRAHSAALCGTLYKPACTAPTAAVASIVACRTTGTTLTFPVTASSNAGLRRITVTFRGTVIKSVGVTGATTKKHFTVALSTRGFAPGLYSLTVKATDARGKSVTRTAHFTICTPKPVFTG